MRLEQLHYLLGIKKYGSMNMAAQNLHVSQQAISYAIKALEEEYGLPLLERLPRKPILTDAGTLVVDTAERIFSEIGQMEAQLKHLHPEAAPPASVILISPSARWHLPTLATEIYKISLNYCIKLFDGSLQGMIDKLLQREADIIVINELEETVKVVDFAQTDFQFIKRFYLYAFVSKHSPLARYRTISIKSVVKYPIVLFGQIDMAGCIFTQLFAQYAPQADIHYLHNTPKEMVSEILHRQNAVTLLPYGQRQFTFLDDCVAIPLKENIAYLICYCTRRDEALPEETIALLHDFLWQEI